MIIIGGSPSTGSSLLVQMLNRHSKIASGSESYLFIHPKLISNWQQNKKHILHSSRVNGLKSVGWLMINGVFLLNEDYGWDVKSIQQLVEQSDSFESFAQAYYQKSMQRNGKTIWIEKTPSNVNSFPTFLEENPKNKTIQITRNPYDTIASVVGRGHSEWYAVGAYVVNTAMALRVAERSNYHQLSYESLINSTEETLEALCQFIGVKFEPQMIPREASAKAIKLKGWRHSETGPIAKSAKGKFHKLPKRAQQRIIQATNHFEIPAAYAHKHQIKHLDCRSICDTLDYEFLHSKRNNSKFLKEQRFKDWLRERVVCSLRKNIFTIE